MHVWLVSYSLWDPRKGRKSQKSKIPRGSMYGIFTYIYHKNQLNVGTYTIHGSYGIDTKNSHNILFRSPPFFQGIILGYPPAISWLGGFLNPGSAGSDLRLRVGAIEVRCGSHWGVTKSGALVINVSPRNGPKHMWTTEVWTPYEWGF